MQIWTSILFCSIFILNKPGGSIFEHESLNFQTSFEKESSQLNTSENAALKRRLAIFYSPRQHSLAHYCCKRSRWISCCAGQKDKLCLKEPKMWKTVRKRSLSHAAAQSTTTTGQFAGISWWIWNIHIKANTIIISFDHCMLPFLRKIRRKMLLDMRIVLYWEWLLWVIHKGWRGRFPVLQ